ncbi:hypothetical protein PUN28_007036 [Cardiocondyla obscurior]|uniref:Uncharacterized protein n=1 Tax=Cardiocondyla obscurior TaxID=286306 RepID=A0AAW2G401_9HYME
MRDISTDSPRARRPSRPSVSSRESELKGTAVFSDAILEPRRRRRVVNRARVDRSLSASRRDTDRILPESQPSSSTRIFLSKATENAAPVKA